MNHLRHIAIRIATMALTLLGASLIVFLIANVVPGDPLSAYAGPKADEETRKRIRAELHLDEPLRVQYLHYLGKLCRGDMGRSYVTDEPVASAIASRFPTTLALSAGGLAIWVLLGVPLGVLTAKYRNSSLDRIILVVCMITISLPTFWLGRLVQYEFAYKHPWFPVAGFTSWSSLVLPCLTLGMVGFGYYARLVHSSMNEVLHLDYIRAARARGLSEPTVLFKHALRNALLPVLTILGMDVAALLGGVVFTERIFGLPGVGQLAVQSAINLDVPMIMGTVLFAAFVVVTMNLLVDVVYRFVDPRIKGT